MIRSLRKSKEVNDKYRDEYVAFIESSARFRTTETIMIGVRRALLEQFKEVGVPTQVLRGSDRVTVRFAAEKEVTEEAPVEVAEPVTEKVAIDYLVSKRGEEGEEYYVVMNEDTEEYLTEDLQWVAEYNEETCKCASKHFARKRKKAKEEKNNA
jgi:hypothetical protein